MAGPPIIVRIPRFGAGAAGAAAAGGAFATGGAVTGGATGSSVAAKPSIVRCAGRSAGRAAGFGAANDPPHWLQKVTASGIEVPHWEQV